jgi:EF hand
MTSPKTSPIHVMLATLAVAAGLSVCNSAMAQTSTMPASAAKPASSIAAPARPTANPAGEAQAASPDQLFALWDVDKNRSLSITEFKNGWESAREQNIMGRLELQFRAGDKNKSGAIEAAEFANLPLIKRGGPGAPPMSAFDANKDQKLDFKEYLELVSAVLKRMAPANK